MLTIKSVKTALKAFNSELKGYEFRSIIGLEDYCNGSALYRLEFVKNEEYYNCDIHVNSDGTYYFNSDIEKGC